MFWYVSELLIAAGTLLLLLASVELGFRFGRTHDRADATIESHLGMLQGSMLGLLALLLGFTFSLSVDRFETRKALVVEEANDIGTTWLRTDFLQPDDGSAARALLERYMHSRLRFYDAGIDVAELERATQEASDLQRDLWDIATRASASEPESHPVALFVQTLNNLIDDSEKRMAALNNHVPDAVIVFLLCIASVAAILIGFGSGLAGFRRPILNASFCLTLALVTMLILDIDRPRRGFITVSQGSMERLASAMATEDETGSRESQGESAATPGANGSPQ